MEEVLCAMALKSSNGRQTHHTLSGHRVCCERALKSAGERNTHGGAGAGAFGKPPARGGVWELAHLASSGDLAAGGVSPAAGKLLTALLGELRSRRRPSGP
jgi:hypothetical protein